MAQNIRGRAVGYALAEIEHRDVVGDLLHHRHVVVDDEDGQAVPLKSLEQADKLALFDVIEAGPRLVEKQELWVAGQRTGDFHEALMPVAEAADARAGARRDADEIERR